MAPRQTRKKTEQTATNTPEEQEPSIPTETPTPIALQTSAEDAELENPPNPVETRESFSLGGEERRYSPIKPGGWNDYDRESGFKQPSSSKSREYLSISTHKPRDFPPSVHELSNEEVKSSDEPWFERPEFEEIIEQKTLTPVDGPLGALLLHKQHYSKVTAYFPAVKPLHTFGDGDSQAQTGSLMSRWINAIMIGREYLQRRFKFDKNDPTKIQLTRSDRRNLKHCLSLLNSTLTRLKRYYDTYVLGYGIDKSRFVELNRELLKLRNMAKEELLVTGDGIPEIPQWGIDGNANHYWSPNDFEILGACYREEVTRFLARLTTVHDFKMLADTDEVGNQEVKPISVPQIKPEKGKQREVVTETPVETASKVEVRIFEEGTPALFVNTPRAPKIRSFVNQNASIFGHPSQHTSSRKMQELMSSQHSPTPPNKQTDKSDRPPEEKDTKEKKEKERRATNPEDPGDNDSDPDDSDDPRRPSGIPVPRPRDRGQQFGQQLSNTNPFIPLEPQFDSKLKPEAIPTWDGNSDELGRWIMKINRLSQRSRIIFEQLGYLVPTRLTGNAETCSIEEFQLAIKFQEDNLLRTGSETSRNRYDNAYGSRDFNPSPRNPFNSMRNARVNAVGWTKTFTNPPFPKDDSNVSPRGTPEEKGGRPCRHCGSLKHWDPDCKYSKRGEKRARVNAVTYSVEDTQALQEYDELYYRRNQSGFLETPSIHENRENGGGNSENTVTTFSAHAYNSPINRETHHLKEQPYATRKTRRKLARYLRTYSARISEELPNTMQTPLTLRRYQARPSGCSFLGSRATQALVAINDPQSKLMPIIIDSGSDITLIAEATWANMLKAPKLRTGQKINLIQVTGKASINGYINVDLHFNTADGPVSMNVDAYVVKGMSTPFILGNDFADQYSISLIRKEGESHILFGETGRSMKVLNCFDTGSKEGDHLGFKIKKLKREHRKRLANREVRSIDQVSIPPETSKLIHVNANFSNDNTLFVERQIMTNRGSTETYGSCDTIIHEENPKIFVSNFSSSPITISRGQIVGRSQNPRSWLDKAFNKSKTELIEAEAHARFIKTL
ncbi:hypothetical protein GALMADRAFT_74250, partial [Galerina marginata CBS 339.88]